MKTVVNPGVICLVVATVLFGPAYTEAQHSGFIVGVAPGAGLQAVPGFGPRRGHVSNPPIVVPGFRHPIAIPHHLPPVLTSRGRSTGLGSFAHRGLHVTRTPHVHVVPHVFGTQIRTPGIVVVQPRMGRFGPGRSRIVRPPAVGTPRADVTNQLGRPVASVHTRDGEILHFSDGVTVLIQNGQVASPR